MFADQDVVCYILMCQLVLVYDCQENVIWLRYLKGHSGRLKKSINTISYIVHNFREIDCTTDLVPQSQLSL